MANRVNIGAKGTKLDYDNWGVPVTEAVNEHDASIISLQNPASVVARRVANQSITTATVTAIQCDTEDFDNAAFFVPTSAIFTLPFDGRYLINIGGNWELNATGDRIIMIYVNGTELFGAGQSSVGSASNVVRQSVGAIITAVAGATVEMRAYQNSGGSRTFTGRVAITYLGR